MGRGGVDRRAAVACGCIVFVGLVVRGAGPVARPAPERGGAFRGRTPRQWDGANSFERIARRRAGRVSPEPRYPVFTVRVCRRSLPSP